LATCAGLGALVAATPVFAQSSVTIYGIVDAAVEHYTNADAAGNSVTRVPSLGGGMFPSRIGFRGTEDLGGGLKAIFALENGFAPDSGTPGQGGRLFGRQAWVGLSGAWGQVTIGRNYNMLTMSTYDIDLFGPSQYGLGSLDASIPNGRSDNSVAYKGTFNGLTLGATYSLGRDTSAAGGPAGTNCAGENALNSQQCREWSAMARYERGNYAAVVAYDRIHGGPLAAGGLVASGMEDSRAHIGALGKWGALRIGGGAIVRDNAGNAATPRSRLLYLAAAYKLDDHLTIDGHLGKLDYRNSGNDTGQVLVRAVYDLSKRSAVYVAAGRIDNDGAAALALSAGGAAGPGLAQTGVIAGIKHAF
jgi:predicted porin